MDYIHHFENDNEFAKHIATKYRVPFVSQTELGGNEYRINYNLTEEEMRESFKSQYLTFKITSPGSIKWVKSRDSTIAARTVEYSKNGGAWTQFTSSTTGTSLSVATGDIVYFRGNNDAYGNGNITDSCGATFSSTTCSFKVYGNVMSLINSTDFKDLSAVTYYAFDGLFTKCTGLTDASNLILPTNLKYYSCGYMFSYCTNLVKGPVIMDTIFNGSDNSGFVGLFSACPNINYIKCLLTNTQHCGSWLYSSSQTGTFVKKAGVEWPRTTSGIPEGWTIIEV